MVQIQTIHPPRYNPRISFSFTRFDFLSDRPVNVLRAAGLVACLGEVAVICQLIWWHSGLGVAKPAPPSGRADVGGDNSVGVLVWLRHS